MKAYIKTALRRRLCLEYSYFDKIPPCTRVIAKLYKVYVVGNMTERKNVPDRNLFLSGTLAFFLLFSLS